MHYVYFYIFAHVYGCEEIFQSRYPFIRSFDVDFTLLRYMFILATEVQSNSCLPWIRTDCLL